MACVSKRVILLCCVGWEARQPWASLGKKRCGAHAESLVVPESGSPGQKAALPPSSTKSRSSKLNRRLGAMQIDETSACCHARGRVSIASALFSSQSPSCRNSATTLAQSAANSDTPASAGSSCLCARRERILAPKSEASSRSIQAGQDEIVAQLRASGAPEEPHPVLKHG